jgi:phage FluMu protein Com
MDYKGSCPRCKTTGVEVGSNIFPLGKTIAMKLTIYNCPKCNLVFFEKATEE